MPTSHSPRGCAGNPLMFSRVLFFKWSAATITTSTVAAPVISRCPFTNPTHVVNREKQIINYRRRRRRVGKEQKKGKVNDKKQKQLEEEVDEDPKVEEAGRGRWKLTGEKRDRGRMVEENKKYTPHKKK